MITEANQRKPTKMQAINWKHTYNDSQTNHWEGKIGRKVVARVRIKEYPYSYFTGITLERVGEKRPPITWTESELNLNPQEILTKCETRLTALELPPITTQD